MYNIYNELNKVTNYIEEHILENIEIGDLARLTGLNQNVLKNVFNCLTGINISEYIRFRRLSLSVNDILNGEKITNIAYKYLYNSPSTYNRAFKRYQGITPRDLIKSNKNIKLFNKIVFKEYSKSYNIEYKIYKNKSFKLYGISIDVDFANRNKIIPNFWKQIKKEMPDFLNQKRYGILNKITKDKTVYSCLLEKKFRNSKQIEIPKCNYFVLKIDNSISDNIISTINKGMNEYIKSLNYKKLNQPNIEIYYNDYTEILIPIT